MKRYSKEVHEFIKENVAGRRIRELVELVNRKMGTEFTYNAMRSYMKNHNLKNGLLHKGFNKGFSMLFPAEIVEFIKNNAEGKGNAEFTELTNKTFETSYTTQQIKTFKKNHKVSSGLDGRFKPGNVSHNKGKKMPPEMYEKCKGTMFRKGNVPKNYMPVGSEKRDSKDHFVYVKIADPNVWKQKHRLLWEQHNGKIKGSQKVIFLDGNRENIVIENLAIVSNAEMLELNRSNLISKDAEITTSGVAVAKLKCAIRKKTKSLNRKRGGNNE